MNRKLNFMVFSFVLAIVAGNEGLASAGDETETRYNDQGSVFGGAENGRFVCGDGFYLLGAQIDAEGSRKNVQVYYDSAVSSVEPMHSGWGLIRAKIPALEVSLLLSSARFLGVYVQRCGTDEWVNVYETPYMDGTTVVEFVDEEQGLYSFHARPYLSIYPGTIIDSDFACGDEQVTFNTYNGCQTLQASGVVQFAYVIEHFAD